MITAGQIVWVPTGVAGQWREWQYSPARLAYGFVGQVGEDRIRFALSRIADRQNPNG